MPYRLNRQEYEIDEVLNRAADLEERGQNPYPGMTYAQGVRDGITWLSEADADDWEENGGYPLPDTQAEDDPEPDPADPDDLPFE